MQLTSSLEPNMPNTVRDPGAICVRPIRERIRPLQSGNYER